MQIGADAYQDSVGPRSG